MSHLTYIFSFIIQRATPSLTGGYTYYEDYPVIIFWAHTLIFSYVFLIPLLLLYMTQSHALLLLHPILTFVIWFFVKLINYLIHNQFDEESRTKDAFASTPIPQIVERVVPPFGISPAIWNIRDRITDFNNVDINTMVSELIEQGYNPNELFHFFEVYQSGQLSLYVQESVNESQQVHNPMTIKIFGCSFVINWTRNDMERWFDRPYSSLEVFFAPLLAMICGLLAFVNATFVTFSTRAVLIFSTASAQFSLLKSPNPDSSSTTMQDPFTPYSRAFHLIFYQFLFFFIRYLSNLSWVATADLRLFNTTVSLSLVLSIISDILKIVIMCFPILNMIGVIGSLVYSIFSSIELLRSYFIGKYGAVSFKYSIVDFLFESVLILIPTLLLYFSENNSFLKHFSYSLCALFGAFLSSFNCWPYLFKLLGLEKNTYVVPNHFSAVTHFLLSALPSLFVGVAVFFLLQFDFVGNHMSVFISSCFVFSSVFIFQFFIPNLTTRFPFGKLSSPVFRQEKAYKLVFKISLLIERYILIPFNISSIIASSKGFSIGFPVFFEKILTSTIIMGITCISFKDPIRFSLVLVMNNFSKDASGFLLFQTFIYLIAFMKLRELNNKLDYVKIYSSFHSVTSVFQVIVLIASLANIQFSYLSIIVATILSSPLIPFCGYSIFLPSYPRPSIFWFETSSFESKPGDSLFYKSLSDSITDRFASDIANGLLTMPQENECYLIFDDYFNAIINIISTGVGYVVFQLRGLEVRDQTLCHRNELQFIRSNYESAEEIKYFMIESIINGLTTPIWSFLDQLFSLLSLPNSLSKKQRSFAEGCIWRPIHESYYLDMYSVTSNRLDLIFPDKQRQQYIHLNLIRVLTLSLSESDEILVPEALMEISSNEIIEMAIPWIEYHEKMPMRNQILAIAHVMIEELNAIAGGFDWKVFKYFTSTYMNMQNYLWIPALIDDKLIKSFRFAISLAVFQASDSLPEGIQELSSFILGKINQVNMMPETEALWPKLIENKAKELETLRQLQEPEGMIIKYYRFIRKEQPYQLVQLNGEAVRGIWAGQITETVFLESTNRERSSIQFNFFTLRNMISQSANSPVGYPETVCPVSFSYSNTLI